VSPIYFDDLFQELAIVLLTIDSAKLPQPSYFNFWFYRVALNINNNSKRGIIQTIHLDELYKEPIEDANNMFEDYKEAEVFMLDLPEFDNRVMHLYNKLGNMKRVEKETGISYSVLRRVKDRLK
jgi:hypothetical protein